MSRLLRYFPVKMRRCTSCNGEGAVMSVVWINHHLMAITGFAGGGVVTAHLLGNGLEMFMLNLFAVVLVGYMVFATMLINHYHNKGYHKGEITWKSMTN